MNAIVLVSKPRHISSFSVVNIVKKAFGAKKAGHLGTLDVEAEGLLVVALDSCTKLFDYFLGKDKTYQTTFVFGEETDTFDLESKITNRNDKVITKQDVERVIPQLVGKQMQVPPVFSAKKIGGQKAYDLARKGKDVNLLPKQVNIKSIKLLKNDKQNTFTFEVDCSSGTYIRALCRDMAAKLSTCAVCYDIKRTRCGGFMLKDAFTLEQIKAGKAQPILPEKLFTYPKTAIDELCQTKLLNGQSLPVKLADGTYRVFGTSFLGIGESKNGVLKLILRLV